MLELGHNVASGESEGQLFHWNHCTQVDFSNTTKFFLWRINGTWLISYYCHWYTVVLVIFCSLTNYPKALQFKVTLIMSQSLWLSGIWKHHRQTVLLQDFFIRLSSKVLTRAAVIWRLYGGEVMLPSSLLWHWLMASVSHHMSFQRLLTTWQVTSPKEREKGTDRQIGRDRQEERVSLTKTKLL